MKQGLAPVELYAKKAELEDMGLTVELRERFNDVVVWYPGQLEGTVLSHERFLSFGLNTSSAT